MIFIGTLISKSILGTMYDIMNVKTCKINAFWSYVIWSTKYTNDETMRRNDALISTELSRMTWWKNDESTTRAILSKCTRPPNE